MSCLGQEHSVHVPLPGNCFYHLNLLLLRSLQILYLVSSCFQLCAQLYNLKRVCQSCTI